MPALLALLAALGQLPAPQLGEVGERVQISADSSELDASSRVLRARGNVVLASGGLRLLAGELAYDARTRSGSAGGGLLFVDGTLAMRAREGAFSLLGGQALVLEGVQMWQKGPGTAARLLALTDPAQAPEAGRNVLLLKADWLERLAKGRFWARKLRLTSCDCASGAAPDWSVWAYRADVQPGERAVLWLPALMVKDVPVLVLPALYVPLSSRRTGFLFPRPAYGPSGFSVEEPFFWAIHESYDLTVSAGWRFGLSQVDDEAGVPIPGREGRFFVRRAARGFRATAELRYAPAEETSGRLFVAAVNDRHSETAALEPRGWRGGLAWHHRSELPLGFAANADVNMVLDARYVGDEAVDVLAEAVPFQRSQAWLGWRGQNVAVAAGTGWYQLNSASFTTTVPWFFGKEAPVGLQRPLVLSAGVPRVRIAGPVEAGVEVTGARYQPVSLLAGPVPEHLLTLTRLDVAPEIAWPLLAGAPVSAELYLRGRGDLASWGNLPQGEQLTVRGRAAVGAWAGTELSRTFLGGALRHTLEPRLEVRAATRRFGRELVLPAADLVAPVDELDVGSEGFVQAVASVGSRLLRKGKGSLLRVEVGQDLDLLAGQASDTFASLEVTPRYVSGWASGRWDWARRQLATVSAGLRLADSRGDSLQAGYDRLLGGGTDRMRGSLDELFGPRVIPSDPAAQGSFDSIGVAATVVPYRGITLSYGVTMDPGMRLDAKGGPAGFLDKIVLHRLGLGLTTSCDCWRVDVQALVGPGLDPRITFLLDLKNLGRIGY